MPVITNPTQGDVHVNRPLTNFAQKYMQEDTQFIAAAACPNMPVAKQTDLYWEFDRHDWFRDVMQKRADGSPTQSTGYKLSTDNYRADVWGIHTPIGDQAAANQDEGLQLELSATQLVTLKGMIRREMLFAEAFMVPSVWATDFTPATLWDADGSSPIVEMTDAMQVVKRDTGGLKPNRLVLGSDVWAAIKNNDDFLSRIIGGATTGSPAVVQRSMLASLLELDSVYVMEGVRTTTEEGAATQSTEFIGANDALLYYAPSALTRNVPSAMGRFSWNGYTGATGDGMRITRWYNMDERATKIESEMAFDFKVIGSGLGYFFQNVVS